MRTGAQWAMRVLLPPALLTAVLLLGLLLTPGCGTGELALPAAQPIAFSHRVHAGDNQIGCTACHAYALHGPVAGVPSAARCQGCHKFISAEKPEVQRLARAYEEGKPLAWTRVHRLPDHVVFAHQRHREAGVGCARCHGAVERMETVTATSPLTMGWCVDCHRSAQASVDCLTCHK